MKCLFRKIDYHHLENAPDWKQFYSFEMRKKKTTTTTESWHNREKTTKEFKVHLKRCQVARCDECNKKKREKNTVRNQIHVTLRSPLWIYRQWNFSYAHFAHTLNLCKYLEFWMQCDPHNNDSDTLLLRILYAPTKKKTKKNTHKPKQFTTNDESRDRERERMYAYIINVKWKRKKIVPHRKCKLYWAGVRFCFWLILVGNFGEFRQHQKERKKTEQQNSAASSLCVQFMFLMPFLLDHW